MNRSGQLAFIARIAPAAQQSAAQTGVPASITIAQGILESGWGESGLAKQANNFFGIKARRADDYAEFATTEFRNGVAGKELARFRKFASEAQCFTAHASLLSQSERYRPAMADADDPFVFAAKLYDCGYSTDPSYAKKLASLITDFHLLDYDVPSSAVLKAYEDRRAMGKEETTSRNKNVSGAADSGESRDGGTRVVSIFRAACRSAAVLLGIVFMLSGCGARNSLRAGGVTAAVIVLERGCLVSVALTDRTECSGADLEHLHCAPLTLVKKVGCEKLRITR